MRSSPSLLYSFKKGGGGETRMPTLFHLKEVILVTFGLSCPIPINNICLSSLIRDQWRRIIVAQIEPK